MAKSSKSSPSEKTTRLSYCFWKPSQFKLLFLVFCAGELVQPASANFASPFYSSGQKISGCSKFTYPTVTDFSGEYGGFAIWKSPSALPSGSAENRLANNKIIEEKERVGFEKNEDNYFSWHNPFTSAQVLNSYPASSDQDPLSSLLGQRATPVRVRFTKTEISQWEFYSIDISFEKGIDDEDDDTISVAVKGMRPGNSASLLITGTGYPLSKLSFIPQWFTPFALNQDKEDSNLNSQTNSSLSSHNLRQSPRHSDAESAKSLFFTPWAMKPNINRMKPVCHISGAMHRLPEAPRAEGGGYYDDEVDKFTHGPDMVAEISFSNGCRTHRGSASLALRKLNFTAITRQQSRVTIILAIKTAIEILLFWLQLRQLESSGSLCKTAPVTLCLHILFDTFEGEFFFVVQSKASQASMFSSLALVGLEKLALILVVEVRWLILLWKEISVRQQNERGVEVRTHRWLRDINSNIRWASVFLISALICVGSLFETVPEILLLLFFFFVPQILHNGYHGTRNACSMWFLVGISLTRGVLPWILWAPSNSPHQLLSGFESAASMDVSAWPSWFYGPNAPDFPPDFLDPIFGAVPRRPNPLMLIVVAAVVGAQVFYLYLQSFMYPRFLWPNWTLKYLPSVFDYREEVSRVVELKKASNPAIIGEDCVICMTMVKFSDRDCVVTPCEHFFHSLCLSKWMLVKMDCPTCRGHLPYM